MVRSREFLLFKILNANQVKIKVSSWKDERSGDLAGFRIAQLSELWGLVRQSRLCARLCKGLPGFVPGSSDRELEALETGSIPRLTDQHSMAGKNSPEHKCANEYQPHEQGLMNHVYKQAVAACKA